MACAKTITDLPNSGTFTVSAGAPELLRNQRGPTCGLYALETVLQSLKPSNLPATKNKDSQQTGSLRQTAKAMGLSKIGELFSVDAVVELAKSCGAKPEAVKVGVMSFFAEICRVVNGGKVALVPFCVADDGEPDSGGKNEDAHWCIALGYALTDPKQVLAMHWGLYWAYDALRLQASNAHIGKVGVWQKQTWGKPKGKRLDAYEAWKQSGDYKKTVEIPEVDLSITLANWIVVL